MNLEEHLDGMRYRMDYDPNCGENCFLVRVVAPGKGMLDGLPADLTKDVFGYGSTFEEAATMAINARFELMRKLMYRRDLLTTSTTH